MARSDTNAGNQLRRVDDSRSDDLRSSPMMAHMLDALNEGTDIGHFGRLTFAIVARHFLPEGEIVRLFSRQPDFSEEDAETLVRQVEVHDYNPPKRERILEWQAQQDFPICPTPDDPGTCNVYRELRFPDDIYENIEDYWEAQVGASSQSPQR